jgi:two-component system, OmpR family, alkaline phosphatase synthesis response regulator PhoP
MKILVIEDDPALNRLLSLHLYAHGYEVVSALGGAEGLRLAGECAIDLVLLDVMMPEIDGWEVCQRLRETSNVPIIMLTAKIQQQDIIHGLILGADDYIKKPFNLHELDLRIEAVLRRCAGANSNDGPLYDDGILCIDTEMGVVRGRGDVIHLSPTEFRLLACLAARSGQIMPHEALVTEVWGPQYADDTKMLSVYIRYLRQKLGQIPNSPPYIHTVWGVGYRFAAPPAATGMEGEAVDDS